MVPLTCQLAAIQAMRRDQIVARLRLRLHRVLGASSRRLSSRVPPAATRVSGFRTQKLGLASPDEFSLTQFRDAVLARAAVIAAGEFRFLNAEREWALPVDWEAPGASRLWRFHLHYFDDAPTLVLAGCIAGEPQFTRLFRELAMDWIARNSVGVGDGWHAYTLSRRIPNWIYALELSGLSGTAGGEPLAVSLWEQTRFLARNLEFDVLGNHLLANLRALLFAASFFVGGEAERWWKTGSQLLQEQLAEQFLPDGGHYERSPMYHALVLQDLLECAALFRRRGQIPAWLTGTIQRAQAWLRQMCHPDGGVALFNDCTLEGPSCAELAAFTGALCGFPQRAGVVGWRQLAWVGEEEASHLPHRPPSAREDDEDRLLDSGSFAALPESGYFVLRDAAAKHALFFDAGDPCPGHVPFHAHADLLSYELSLFGRRVIVDSGVCEYAPGAWRDYCRSTRAHNTVRVDGHDQSEVWGSFRLGRRAHPVGVRWNAANGGAEVSAAHSGYQRLRGGVVHRRTVVYDGRRYRVDDEVTGSGRHRIESFLHFHPEMSVHLEAHRLVAGGQGVRLVIRFHRGLSADLQRGWMPTVRVGAAAPLHGWYCPEFGLRQPNPVVVLIWEGRLPARVGYEIEPLVAACPS
jgi:uncharacterized heparinase superfamily protein